MDRNRLYKAIVVLGSMGLLATAGFAWWFFTHVVVIVQNLGQ